MVPVVFTPVPTPPDILGVPKPGRRAQTGLLHEQGRLVTGGLTHSLDCSNMGGQMWAWAARLLRELYCFHCNILQPSLVHSISRD